MSRRASKEDKKLERNKRKDDRKKGIRKELDRVIIACEGSKTERHYFQAIFDELVKNHNIAKTSLVIANHSHTDPKGVLSDLEKALETDSEFEHKWIVIDRDEVKPNGGGHDIENFNGAISRAEAHGINVAYSNPSFEIWYLLHFEYRNTALTRDEVITELKKYVDYEKNSKTIYIELLTSQKFAIDNAKKLEAVYTPFERMLQPAIDNPSTTVYRLVEVLNTLGREE